MCLYFYVTDVLINSLSTGTISYSERMSVSVYGRTCRQTDRQIDR